MDCLVSLTQESIWEVLGFPSGTGCFLAWWNFRQGGGVLMEETVI